MEKNMHGSYDVRFTMYKYGKKWMHDSRKFFRNDSNPSILTFPGDEPDEPFLIQNSLNKFIAPKYV